MILNYESFLSYIKSRGYSTYRLRQQKLLSETTLPHDIAVEYVHRRWKNRVHALYKILSYCDEVVFFDNVNGFVEVGHDEKRKVCRHNSRHAAVACGAALTQEEPVVKSAGGTVWT